MSELVLSLPPRHRRVSVTFTVLLGFCLQDISASTSGYDQDWPYGCSTENREKLISHAGKRKPASCAAQAL